MITICISTIKHLLMVLSKLKRTKKSFFSKIFDRQKVTRKHSKHQSFLIVISYSDIVSRHKTNSCD